MAISYETGETGADRTGPQSIAPFLDGLVVQPGASYQGLHIFPVCVVAAEFDRPGLVVESLSRGLSTGRLLVGETGAMDTVRVRNAGTAPALLLDGETLIGGAQNRMLNAAALISPRIEAELPGSCIEVHRWDIKDKDNIPEDKRAFRASSMAYGQLRRLRMDHAQRSLRADRTVRIDQKAVWQDIVSRFGISGARTRTLDLHDLHEFWDAALRIMEPRFYIHKNQTGLISFLDKRTWFLDLFPSHDLLYPYFKSLVRAYAFDALIRLEAGTPSRGKALIEDARDVLKSLRTALCHAFPAPGGAAGLFFATRTGHGAALIADQNLLHLTACSQ